MLYSPLSYLYLRIVTYLHTQWFLSRLDEFDFVDHCLLFFGRLYLGTFWSIPTWFSVVESIQHYPPGKSYYGFLTWILIIVISVLISKISCSHWLSDFPQSHLAFTNYHDLLEDLEEKLSSVASVEAKWTMISVSRLLSVMNGSLLKWSGQVTKKMSLNRTMLSFLWIWLWGPRNYIHVLIHL